MLTQSDILSGLRRLDVRSGDRLLVHSSLASLGRVNGGADTVIDALLEAVGPEGLVAMPTFACSAPFDRHKSSTPLGAIADSFWRRPQAVRSLHPTHSLAAIGRGADELIAGHEKAPSAYAEGTPYLKLARSGGRILLLGVDQDRNTTLHAAEALAGAPYLKSITADYIDDEGHVVNIPIEAMAGPHRDFIGLDKLFRERGIQRLGRIGKAVCRLIEAGPMLEAALEALRRDAAAVLCDNPACDDCIRQRGLIKAARLAEETFTLAAVAGDISDDPDVLLKVLAGEGILRLELTAAEYAAWGRRLADKGVLPAALRAPAVDERLLALAAEAGVPLIVPAGNEAEFKAAAAAAARGRDVMVENTGLPSSEYLRFYADIAEAPGLAFNPGRFAAAGEKPFLQVFYHGALRRHVRHLYLDDALSDGTTALPGRGNGEVKEILSMLCCRSFSGTVTLRSGGHGPEAFRQAAAAFWRLLDSM